MIALFGHKCKRENQKLLQKKPLQLGHCNETTEKRLSLSSTPPYLYLVRIQTIQFLFGKFLTYPDNKYINNCFFDLHLKYFPRLSHNLR